jgi:DNA helicase-2/ATP-dependent DNA helicase PcrA
MNNINKLIENLNKEQKNAVLNTEGPNLIVAGAGSGKTRVLTTRLIHIINEKKAWANQILCVTFTNKAAKEMQNRVMSYIKGSSNAVPWLGTFHSISVKFLRRHAEALDYKSNFTILDTDDQKKLMRNIVKSEELDAKKFSPQLIMYHIDQWKNKGLLPKDVKIEKSGSIIKSILKVYEIYQKKTQDLNAFDFGDLILFCVKLFEEHKDIREVYQNNFKYILVDEFQDTNFIQNKWLKLLVNKKENICCVGDDDQSIYSWRGAEIKNFLTFDQIYKNCKVFKLEQNYRSTKNILATASSLISNNSNRVGKKLWSSANQGELVKLNCYKTGKDEAIGISDIIEHNLKKKYSLNDVSILVRAIYQTREFEERFLQVGIGYRVLGGIKFYERSEIKDAVSYLRIINQKFDDLALERVIGSPRRGVGESTLNQIYLFGNQNKLCLEESIIKLLEKGEFKPKIKTSLTQLINMIHKWRGEAKNIKHYDLLKLVLDESGYSSMLKNKKDLENENR